MCDEKAVKLQTLSERERGKRDCQHGECLEGQSEEYYEGFGEEYAEAAGMDKRTEEV